MAPPRDGPGSIETQRNQNACTGFINGEATHAGVVEIPDHHLIRKVYGGEEALQ